MNVRWLAVALVPVLIACGSDDTPGADAAPEVDAPEVDAPPPIDAATAARLQATVSYTGAAQGSLILAAFPSMPPMGPPIGFAQAAQPAFPATLAIENLEAGTIYVLAVLDVAPASPTQPGPEDRQAWSAALSLTVGATTMTTLTLSDP